jgi:transcription elongation regulator 1
VWSEHKREDGRTYYYNKITMTSVWTKPQDYDLVLPMPVALAGEQKEEKTEQQTSTETPEQPNEEETKEEPPKDVEDVKQVETEETKVPMEDVTEQEDPPTQQSEKDPTPEVTEAPKEEGTKPIATQPVSGTPWSIVWTNDERYFFFNATTRDSVWSIPEDIQHLPVLKVLLAAPPGRKRPEGPTGPSDDPEPDAKKLKSEGPSVGETDQPLDSVPMETDSHPNDPKYGKLNLRRASMSLEERHTEFKEMLLERGVSAFSTWEKELPKFCFDERYRLLNAKERKSAFDEFVKERAEDERKEKKQKLKQVKENFRSLMEEAKLTPRSTFSEFSSKFSRDDRFKAVERAKERETLFAEFISEMKKLKKDNEKAAKSKEEKIKEDFFAMLSRDGSLSSSVTWKHVKSHFRGDPAYSAVEKSSQREELYLQYLETLDLERIERERIQHSLREREKEVQMSRSRQEKEWDKEKDNLRKSEATGLFKSMLVDLVRRTDLTWHDGRKSMKKDPRWEGTEVLDLADREAMFRQHTKELVEKKRNAFRRLLSETPQVHT